MFKNLHSPNKASMSLISLTLLAACGQTGPLYLPDEPPLIDPSVPLQAQEPIVIDPTTPPITTEADD